MKNILELEVTSDSKVAFERINRQGFALVDLGIPSEFVEAMKQKLVQLVEADLSDLSKNPFYRDHWMVMNLMFRDQIFADLIGKPQIQNLVEPILGEPFIIYSFTSSSMPAGGTNFSRRIHNDAPRFIPGYVTNVGLVIALDEFTSLNGATQALPFSQNREDKPSEEEFSNECIEILAKPGHGLLFNARLWHSGGQNQSDKPRNALTLNFCRSYMRQHFDFWSMYEKNGETTLNEQARKLIGERVRMPKSLDEYYVSTEDRKYQPGQG